MPHFHFDTFLSMPELRRKSLTGVYYFLDVSPNFNIKRLENFYLDPVTETEIDKEALYKIFVLLMYK